MSIDVSKVVWDDAPFYDGGTLIVLLALAEYADDKGVCWPHIDTIARRARLGLRQTRNILRQLKGDGVLLVERGGGRGIHSRYRLCVETLKSISVKPNSVKPVSMKSTPETLQSSSLNSAIRDIAIRKNRQEPSIEPPARVSFPNSKLPGSPKPSCEKCGGTGRYETTAHPGEPNVCWCVRKGHTA